MLSFLAQSGDVHITSPTIPDPPRMIGHVRSMLPMLLLQWDATGPCKTRGRCHQYSFAQNTTTRHQAEYHFDRMQAGLMKLKVVFHAT